MIKKRLRMMKKKRLRMKKKKKRRMTTVAMMVMTRDLTTRASVKIS